MPARRSARLRRGIAGGVAALCLLYAGTSQKTREAVRRDSAKEYALKAQMLKKMLNYVSWPKQALVPGKSVFRIGVLGRDPFRGRLQKAFAGARVHGCPVKVVALGFWPRKPPADSGSRGSGRGEKAKQEPKPKPKPKKPDPAPPVGFDSCHAIFIADSEAGVLERVLEKARRRAVWIIADSPGFGRRGAHINFMIVGTKVRFETNAKAARRCGVQMSSKLLRLGTKVGGR